MEVKHRVVFGTKAAVDRVLSACGWQINTSFVERINLSLRQRVAAIRRRATTLCKGEAGVCQQLALSQVYHNFVLPHASLRQALPSRYPPTARALPSSGGPARRRWRRDSPITYGLYEKCCCSACRRGRSYRVCKKRGLSIILELCGSGVSAIRPRALNEVLKTRCENS